MSSFVLKLFSFSSLNVKMVLQYDFSYFSWKVKRIKKKKKLFERFSFKIRLKISSALTTGSKSSLKIKCINWNINFFIGWEGVKGLVLFLFCFHLTVYFFIYFHFFFVFFFFCLYFLCLTFFPKFKEENIFLFLCH